MKKYMFCFLLFAATSLLCLGIGFVITKDSVQPEEAIPGATLETETVTEDQIVINQEKVSPAPEKEKEKYYLVSEDGYLLVLYQDKTTICLYTHMPVTDFPEEERGRLMDGIWFSSMIEVFNYLESYTS
ncbi:hypothetical protein [Hungatella effluvii]|uniref:hypothetical protein n=1 Tax=Hungatella effluvii TaxID=1096246 RepID=UPI002A808A2A|nr:hypothetical protein [Hungatella effluvii]